MKPSRAPLITLCALLFAAAATLAGGFFLAKRDTVERKQLGHDELSTFSDSLRDELERLDALYESHLIGVATQVVRGSEISIRAAGSHLIGLHQISLVPIHGRGIHATYPLRDGDERPEIPVFAGNERERSAGRETFEFAPAGDRGWIGDWFYYHRPDLDLFVLISTHREEVLGAMQTYLTNWYHLDFEPVAATGADVEIKSPLGKILAPALLVEDGAQNEFPQADRTRRPDLVIPLKSRSGRWRLATWDEVNVSSTYHAPTLTIASAIALSLVLLGTITFFHQRRWHHLAEQRVSFVNRVSHELRTPLTNILLNADLAEATMNSAPEEAGRRLKLVNEEAERLSRLITNVLSFSKGGNEVADLRVEPIDLRTLSKSVLESFRPALERRGIQVDLDFQSDTHALGDPDAFAQILSNLISNVEKYASSGGWMKIATSADAGGVKLSVSDRGPGIPPGAEARIFTAFERLGERVDEGVTGTGLGLAIARDLARRMGGEVTLEKREKTGARFVLNLPKAPDNVIGISRRTAS